MTTTELASEYEAKQIFKELALEEDRLSVADQELGDVLARYRIAESRYTALRELARERLGQTPYADQFVPHWPSPIPEVWGRYRYRDMKIGDAISEFLSRSSGPKSLANIYQGLRDGGMNDATKRAVNAALMNLNGVTKYGNGNYAYDDAE